MVHSLVVLLALPLSCAEPDSVSSRTADGDPRAEATLIIERMLQSFELLDSVEFEMTFESPSLPDGKRRMRYYASGSKWRYEAFEIPSSGDKDEGRTDTRQAYNGELFQFLDGSEQTLATSFRADQRDIGQSPYPTPLWLHLMWLFEPGETRSWEVVKNRESWMKLLPLVKQVREVIEDDVRYSVVSFRNEREYAWDLYFANDLGFYPLLYLEVDPHGSQSTIARVEEWKTFEIEQQLAVIPTNVTLRQLSGDEMIIKRRCRIVEDTLQVNHVIDVESFTISPELAAEVYDLDTGLVRNVENGTMFRLDADGNPIDIPPAAIPLEESRSGTFLWLLIANGLVIACLIAFVAMRRFRTS